MNESIRNGRELGQAIRALRIEQALTQEELAKRAAVSRAFIIGLEKGNKPGAELSRIFRVLQALGQTVAIKEERRLSFEDALKQLVGEAQA